MKFPRIFGYTLATLAGVTTVGIGIALWAYRDIPADVLEARYVGRASKFINIDGVRIHFRDEGEGPAVLLLHAGFGSLMDWDSWADALDDAYRIVRMDFPGHGLTGPDPRGDYSLERTLELTETFIDAMDLDTFSIAGSSMGGRIAALIAKAHPERIENLIIVNPIALESGRGPTGSGATVPKSAWVLTYITPRWLARYMLESRFGDRERLTDELIDRWHDLWLREGQREAQLKRLEQAATEETEDIIPALKPRTLLLWGEADSQADLMQKDAYRQRFENVESLSIHIYPNVGRMPELEIGQETGRDVRAFLELGRQSAAEQTALR